MGLRWWNYIDENGDSQWMFEKRNGDSQNLLSATEVKYEYQQNIFGLVNAGCLSPFTP